MRHRWTTRRTVRHTLLVPLLALAALAAATGASAQVAPAGTSTTTITYQAATGVIPNPDRGFYRPADTDYLDASGTGWKPLSEATLRSWRAEGITQVLREFWMQYNGGAEGAWNLTPDFLRKVDADFATARRAGVKMIVRFGYTLPPDGVWPPPTPYGDAPVARVLHHISQLEPLLRRNADVIATVQEGFIGLWGEGYYTDYFSNPTDPSAVSEKNWADRAAVLKALLHALPPSVTVQVRTMFMKQRIFGVSTGYAGALTSAQAFSGSDLARVGFHNDCFLASPDDYGTFLSDPLSLDKWYLGADSRYVPVGGETCFVNPPRSEWPNAEAQMTRYHYSYLNIEYEPGVLASWGSAGLEAASERLGYRLALTQGTYPSQVAAGRSLQVQFTVHNSGFAAPYAPQGAQLVLTDGHRTYRLPLDTDIRRWVAGTDTTVTTRVPVPRSVVPGTYRLALALPSSFPSIAGRSDYAVQLANSGTWDSRDGWNWLKSNVEVKG